MSGLGIHLNAELDDGRTVVIGAGGHGHDIAASLGHKFAGFYDDKVTGDLVIGTLDDWRANESRPFIIGVNDPRTRWQIRESYPGPMYSGHWVHPSASLGPDVECNWHLHVNANASVTRTYFGYGCTVSPGATVCGDVRVGTLVTIGAGAVICQFCVIGDGATIAAGAVLPPHTNVPCNETWGGVPARRLS